jgi:hypothetical protein
MIAFSNEQERPFSLLLGLRDKRKFAKGAKRFLVTAGQFEDSRKHGKCWSEVLERFRMVFEDFWRFKTSFEQILRKF